MAITEKDVIDSVAYENNYLLLQLYDHLDFDEEFEKVHLLMLQDKLNTYIWYIDSKQYEDTYPQRRFDCFIIRVFFMFEPTELSIRFISHVNERLSDTGIKVEYVVDNKTQ